MSVPEQYRKYVTPVGQRPVYPREVELYGEADPIVHVPDPYNPNRSVEVRRSALTPATPTPPRDLTPQPLFDPKAQRMVGAGVGAGVALWGGGQFLVGAGQFVSGLTGMGALVLFLALAGGRALLMGGRGVVHVHNEAHTHVQQKWLGRTDVRNEF